MKVRNPSKHDLKAELFGHGYVEIPAGATVEVIDGLGKLFLNPAVLGVALEEVVDVVHAPEPEPELVDVPDVQVKRAPARKAKNKKEVTESETE